MLELFFHILICYSSFFSTQKTKYLTNTKIVLAKNSNKIHPVIGFWHISLLKNLEDFLDKDSKEMGFNSKGKVKDSER